LTDNRRRTHDANFSRWPVQRRSIDHVKTADAARRALAGAVVEADHHRGAMKPFDDARSDDAQYPRMPALAVQDQRVPFGAVHAPVGLIERLL
jgi:hypothetical protein